MKRAALLALLLACKKAPPVSDATAPLLEVSGCDAVTLVACELTEGQEIRVLENGVAVTRKVSVDGKQFVAATKPAWLRDATTLRKSGKLEDAQKAADEHAKDGGVDGARAAGLAARIALARGKTEDAVAAFRRSIPVYAAAGRISEEADDRFAASWALSQILLRFDEARAILDEGSIHVRAFPDGRAREHHYRGLIALRAGDLRAAIDALSNAKRETTRLGLTADARDAEESAASTLFAIGRAGEARTRLLALETSGAADPVCRRADRSMNLAQTEIALGMFDVAAQTLDAALTRVRAGCASGWRERNVLNDIARTSLMRGSVASAKSTLVAARALPGTAVTWLVASEADIEGQIALREGRGNDALTAFSREEALSTGLVEARWRARVGLAEAKVLLHRDEEARVAFLAAEQILDDSTALVPLGEGRALFAAGRDRGTRGLIELLVRIGKRAEAMTVVRRARARALRGLVVASEVATLSPERRARFDRAVSEYRRERAALEADAANDWSLPDAELVRVREARAVREKALRTSLEAATAVLDRSRAELPPWKLEPGVVALALHPTSAGYVLLAATADETIARTVPLLENLDSLAEVLRAAKRVRVIGGNELDVHAIVFDGAPLGERVVVEYSLDLAAAPANSATRTVLVSDPDGNLPSARAEGDAIEKLAPSPVLRFHQTAAKLVDVSAALADASVFHFAGHGRVGESGLESSLALADGARLTVADLIALPRAPSFAILTACEAAHASQRAEGLGLAHAFVLAGARAAIAPTRPVKDELALAVARALYGGPIDDLAAALQRALRVVRAATPAEDWASFRAIVR